jgi:hypothetical protein
VRIEPEFREEIERVLIDGETLSQFVEAAVRASVHHRQDQSEFIARGLRSLAKAKQTGEYYDAADVMDRLRRKLAAAKARKATPTS